MIITISVFDIIKPYSLQVEKHFPDGTKEILFPDSTRKVIYADGLQESYFPDGVIVKEHADGTKEIL